MPRVADLFEQAEGTVASALHHVDRQGVVVGFYGAAVAGLGGMSAGALVLEKLSRQFLKQLLVNRDSNVSPGCGGEPAIYPANGLTGHDVADLRSRPWGSFIMPH